jgi:pSer/pThr/pTyr-binding forkhead associated (FHA) protein
MSARSSVSAQRNAPEVPDDGLPDETIVAPRRRPRWMLVPPLGAAIPLTSDVVIVGRRPVADARHPGAQLVPIADETRTMSKTHARLERRDDTWIVTDLASTNGVAVVAEDGAEIEIGESGSATIGERFLLGDAELRLTRTEP